MKLHIADNLTNRNFIAFFIEDAWCEVERIFDVEETTYIVTFKNVRWLLEFTTDPFAHLISDERRSEALRGFAIGVLKMHGQL